MNHLKQNIWVVSILFLSLMSSVALSYMITPNSKTMTETKKIMQPIKADPKPKSLNQSFTLLLPKVGK
jgi:preprotein translocase subunit YajC